MNTVLYFDTKFIIRIFFIMVLYIILFGISIGNNFVKSFDDDTYIKKASFSSEESLLSFLPWQATSKLKQIEQWEQKIALKYTKYKPIHIATGIKHIKINKLINNKPVAINIIEINRQINNNLDIKPALASNKTLSQKARIEKIAKKSNAVAALNAGFFKPESGVPLGTLMIDKKLITGPIYNRVALGIAPDHYKMSRLGIEASLVSKNLQVKIDNINQPRISSAYTLAYTADWGAVSPPAPKYGKQILIQNGVVKKVSDRSMQIPKDGYVIVAPYKKIKQFKVGQKAAVEILTNPSWGEINHIVSGGPYLVKNAEVFVDIREQKFNSIRGKHPRSAIGYTESGNLVLVAVDGRNNNSVGMTLIELATLMKDLGCYNAMNLDGGGSTQMYINGKIVNNPSGKRGLAISNTIILSLKN